MIIVLGGERMSLEDANRRWCEMRDRLKARAIVLNPAVPYDASYDSGAHSISIELPADAPVASCTPTITVTAENLDPVVKGTIVSHDGVTRTKVEIPAAEFYAPKRAKGSKKPRRA